MYFEIHKLDSTGLPPGRLKTFLKSQVDKFWLYRALVSFPTIPVAKELHIILEVYVTSNPYSAEMPQKLNKRRICLRVNIPQNDGCNMYFTGVK
jgi:hypothetical protein